MSGTYEQAKGLADMLRDAEVYASRLESGLQHDKFILAQARHELEVETAKFALHAQTEGVLDGKNAEARKWQFDSLVDADAALSQVRDRIVFQEGELCATEGAAARARAETHWLHNLFKLELAAFSQPPMPPGDLLAQALDLANAVETGKQVESPAATEEEDPF